MESVLNQIKFFKQRKIKVKGGDVFHILKKSSSNNFSFGEAYFSFIDYNVIKGWKFHKKIKMNLCVAVGKVKFYFVSKDFKYKREFVMGEENYGRLYVPPNIWYCFKGLGKNKNMILNLTDLEHDDNEINKINLEDFPLKIKL